MPGSTPCPAANGGTRRCPAPGVHGRTPPTRLRRLPHDRCRSSCPGCRPRRSCGSRGGESSSSADIATRSRRPDRRAAARMDRIGRPPVLHRVRGARRTLLVHRDRSSGPRSRAANARRRSTFDDVADDHVAVARQLGIERAVLVGYSMGGPIALTIAHRHPAFVTGIVVQATALEWLASRRERWRWRFLPVLGSVLRSRWYPTFVRSGLPRLIPDGHDLDAVPRLARSGDPSRRLAHDHPGRMGAEPVRCPSLGAELGVPAGSLITTHDRLVRPRKQRALAAALGRDHPGVGRRSPCPVGAAASVLVADRGTGRRCGRAFGRRAVVVSNVDLIAQLLDHA